MDTETALHKTADPVNITRKQVKYCSLFVLRIINYKLNNVHKPKSYSTQGGENNASDRPPNIWPRVTLTFDLLAQELIVSYPCTMDLPICIKINSFTIVITSLATDEKCTNKRGNKRTSRTTVYRQPSLAEAQNRTISVKTLHQQSYSNFSAVN